MKKILITGKHGYIAGCFGKYVHEKYSSEFKTEQISLRDNEWKDLDFSQYDVVFHCAAIVHREGECSEEEYIKVNTELTKSLALKAKTEGVTQFIFMSSMSVYGLETGEITKQTVPAPKSMYGKSKLLAEEALLGMNSEAFRVTIVRAPMVYGPGCKGNYQRLSALARRLPIFPSYKNKRSMIFIDKLSEFVARLISDGSAGIFCPQNDCYVCTSELVKEIAEAHGHRIWITPLLNPFVVLGMKIPGKLGRLFRKVWGCLYYEKEFG